MKKSQPKNTPDYLLKIFNGLHQGAEVSLPEGKYTIGNSDSCDIILHDQGIAPQHMVISVVDDGILVSAIEGMVVVDGKNVGNKELKVDPLKLIGLGQVFIGVGFIGDNWVPDTFPEILPDPEESSVSPLGSSKNSTMTWPQKIMIAGFFMPVIGIILFILTGGNTLEIKGSDIVTGIFKSHNLPEPIISNKKNIGLTVVGYTKNASQKKMIINEIEKIEIPISYKIYIDSDLIDATKDILAKMNLHVEAIYNGQGRFSLNGIVKDRWNVQKVVLKLKQDIAGIRDIDNNIWLEEDVIEGLKDIVVGSGLKDKVKIVPYADYFLVSGVLTDKERLQWEKAKSYGFEKYGKYLNIREKIDEPQVAKSGPGIIKLPLKSVHIGDLPYITLNDGKKYFEGGSLKSGYTIKSITSKRIEVLIKGKVYYCNL